VSANQQGGKQWGKENRIPVQQRANSRRLELGIVREWICRWPTCGPPL
jgi:hypothetical protein